MHIKDHPEQNIVSTKPYIFIGEYDVPTKRFILDRVFPIPDTYNNPDMKKYYDGKPVILFSLLYENSVKYVCE
jgi:hypothetical protein